MELAKTTNVPVLFTPAEIPVEVAAAIKSPDEPVVVKLKRAPIMAIQPTGEEVQLAVVVTPPPPAELQVAAAPIPDALPAQLPATSSSTPLIGLAGLISLCGAFWFRKAAKV